MMTSQDIRKAFLDFFASKEHHIVPSAPMVIKGDPTLMFTNAGMNQFKDIILGNVAPTYKRVSDAQKCLRVSGKHNDLEEVGHDTYHHTMFEMLGNWSFGDYFKKEAIAYAWEFLTKVVNIPEDRLYITVFEGDEAHGLERDQEAADYWAEWVSADRIIGGNAHDNFWEMGDQGPCGPCSEIHVDLRSDEERKAKPGYTLVNKDDPRVVEIWNLVFMQYNRHASGELSPLPHKVIDTGMGFERLCMVLQGKQSTYDTDVFQPLIKAIGTASGKQYGDNAATDIAMRVVADHVRTIAFAITDGQLPGNAKAGYVIRRILRRAVRYGYTFLGFKSPFLYSLIPTLIEVMGDAYPELIGQRELIEKVILQEEESFLRTLEAGIKLLSKKIEELGSDTQLSGDDAFTLYDTFGFPLDLTELIAHENNKTVDLDRFNELLMAQKERARTAASVQTEDWINVNEGTTLFVGYDQTECTTDILRFRKIKQKNKSFYQVVLSHSPFYAEMGGQVGDSGTLIDESGEAYPIIDTKREDNLAVHLMPQLPKDVSQTFIARINCSLRTLTEANHTATHLLHQALREKLGKHVEQRGSFVSPEVLRFDFSHFAKMTEEEIRSVEERVNELIRQDIKRDEMRNVPIEEAKQMGAMALFGEKYGEVVRVLRYGDSIELCGGTHIASTGKIGMFRITSESSIAAGVRRIEAVTGVNAERWMYDQEDLLRSVREQLNGTPDVNKAIQRLIEENKNYQAELKALYTEKTQTLKKQLLQGKQTVASYRLFTLEGDVKPDVVKDLAFQLKGEVKEPFAFVAATYTGIRSLLTVLLTEELIQAGLNASDLVRNAAKLIRGGGGGQPHFATAGGKGDEGLKEAMQQIIHNIEAKG